MCNIYKNNLIILSQLEKDQLIYIKEETNQLKLENRYLTYLRNGTDEAKIGDIINTSFLAITNNYLLNISYNETIHNENLLENNKFESYRVRAEKLDNLIKKENIGFIKIDVEGHEKNVLIGAEQIIKKCKPNLLIEIEERHTNDKVQNTINFINDFGYNSFFSDGKNLIETKKLDNFNTKNNFFFIP